MIDGKLSAFLKLCRQSSAPVSASRAVRNIPVFVWNKVKARPAATTNPE